MRPSPRSLASVFSALALFVSFAMSSNAQSAKAVASSARILAQVNTTQTARLKGHVPAWATAANDQGQLDRTRRLDNLHLTLARAPQIEAAFQQLLLDQQNPASPRYHQWLTPQQNAEQYGIAASDLAAVTNWLRSQGLSVDDVAAGGVFITFSGPVPAVENAFSINLHNFMQEGVSHYAPTEEPAVPAALAGVITSINGIAEATFKSQAHPFGRPIPAASLYPSSGSVTPDFTLQDGSGNAVHLLAPGDFNLIYDVNPELNAGITGTGNRVAVLGASAVAAADITAYENLYGLSAQQPTVKVPPSGTNPGATGNSSQDEATLDVDRVIGTAPGAGVDLLIMTNGLSTNNIFTLLQYNISTLNDPVQNLSFGLCEQSGGTANTQQFDSLFKTASVQGISTVVSSGDTGAAGCDVNGSDAPATQSLNINLLCASSYATCVGATEFADFSDPSAYWSATNNQTTQVSARGYIPEGAWNEQDVDAKTGKYEPGATGGGVSTIIAKPSFQTGTGVPSGNFRDVPDVALAGSTHNAYVICEAFEGTDCSSTFSAVGGTSAAAPSMGGIISLLDQKLGGRQGNVNPLLYQLAATTSNDVFHDVTVATSGVTGCTLQTPSMCNNSTPGPTSLTGGLQGYEVDTGYDLATGLGSLDVANFLTAAAAAGGAPSPPSFSLTPFSASLTLLAGATTGNTDTLALASLSGFSGTVALTCAVSNASGTAVGTCAVAPASVTLASSGTATNGTSVLTVNTTTGTSGTLNVTVTGVSGSITVTSSIAVTVTAPPVPSFTLSAATPSLSLTAGATTGNTDTFTLASTNGFAGAVALTCAVSNTSGTAAGTCTVAPTLVPLSLGGTGTSVLTVNTTAGTSGALNVTVTGVNGEITVTSSIKVTVTAPAAPTFSFNTSIPPLSFTSGATTGNSDTLTLTSLNGFAGPVAITCSISTSSAAFQPMCSAAPASVTLTAGGTGTSVISITSTTAQASAKTEPANFAQRWSLGSGAFLAMLLFFPSLRRRKVLSSLVVCVVMLAGIASLSGCGGSSSGGSSSTSSTSKSSAGTYTVTVTGNGGTTASTVSTTFSVTIN